jgi:hypothetical protein
MANRFAGAQGRRSNDSLGPSAAVRVRHALREHPEALERVVFYGYALHEQMVMAEVVSAAFGPSVEMPSELREHLP